MKNIMNTIDTNLCFRWYMEQTKEARFLPGLVQNKVQVGIIFNGNNDVIKELLKDDILSNGISDLDERKFGIDSWDELPDNFERKQFLDENYKLNNGENQKEVRDRMYSVIMKILNEYHNKRIAIVSHGTAISYLLKKWCDVSIVNNKLRYSFKNEIILDGYFNYCETFKLVFDDENKLIDIKNIKLD